MKKEEKLYCPRCCKNVEHVIWRYVQPVDDYAVWSDFNGDYVYDDSIDKGQLDCLTLCGECELNLSDKASMNPELALGIETRQDKLQIDSNTGENPELLRGEPERTL